MLGVGVSPRLPCISLHLSCIALHFPYISFTSPRHLSSISQYLPRLLDQRRLRPLRAQLQDTRALVLLALAHVREELRDALQPELPLEVAHLVSSQ